MTYVVSESCIRCKYTDCVEVCPVDCIYEGENMLVIRPDECIDCGVCEPECPIAKARQGRLTREDSCAAARSQPNEPAHAAVPPGPAAGLGARAGTRLHRTRAHRRW